MVTISGDLLVPPIATNDICFSFLYLTSVIYTTGGIKVLFRHPDAGYGMLLDDRPTSQWSFLFL